MSMAMSLMELMSSMTASAGAALAAMPLGDVMPAPSSPGPLRAEELAGSINRMLY